MLVADTLPARAQIRIQASPQDAIEIFRVVPVRDETRFQCRAS